MENGLKSNVKLFADDTSILASSWTKMIKKSLKDLTDDLSLIPKWKMLFSPDPTKPAQEVIFSRKKRIILIKIYFLTINQLKELHTKSILEYVLTEI